MVEYVSNVSPTLIFALPMSELSIARRLCLPTVQCYFFFTLMQLFPYSQGTFCQPKYLQLRIFLLFSPKALEKDIIITSKVSKIQGEQDKDQKLYSYKQRSEWITDSSHVWTVIDSLAENLAVSSAVHAFCSGLK